MSEGKAPAFERKLEYRVILQPGVTLHGTWVPWEVVEQLLADFDYVEVPDESVRTALMAASLVHEGDEGGVWTSAADDAALEKLRDTTEMTPEPSLDPAVLTAARAALHRGFHPSVTGAVPDASAQQRLLEADMALALAAHRLSRREGEPEAPSLDSPELAAIIAARATMRRLFTAGGRRSAGVDVKSALVSADRLFSLAERKLRDGE